MSRFESMTESELHSLSDDELRALEKATQKLADEMQRQTAHYQRQAARMRKRLQARRDAQGAR